MNHRFVRCILLRPFSFYNVVDAYGKDGQLARTLVQTNANPTEIAADSENEVNLNLILACGLYRVMMFFLIVIKWEQYHLFFARHAGQRIARSQFES